MRGRLYKLYVHETFIPHELKKSEERTGDFIFCGTFTSRRDAVLYAQSLILSKLLKKAEAWRRRLPVLKAGKPIKEIKQFYKITEE